MRATHKQACRVFYNKQCMIKFKFYYFTDAIELSIYFTVTTLFQVHCSMEMTIKSQMWNSYFLE